MDFTSAGPPAMKRVTAVAISTIQVSCQLVSRPMKIVTLVAVAAIAGCAAKAPAPLAVQANDNRTPAGIMRDDILSLDLEARTGQWQPEGPSRPILQVPVFAETGLPPQAPGPLIRVPTGTRLAVRVSNRLPVAIDVHGLHDRPGHTDDKLTLASGASRELRFASGPPGTYFYWATIAGHTLEKRYGYDGQLTGAFIVDPPGVDSRRPDDRIFVIGHWTPDGEPNSRPEFADAESWVLNGLSWPATERLVYPVNRPIHWRVINASYEVHPMHLHGNYFHISSKGDEGTTTSIAAADRPMVATEPMQSGKTIEMTWIPRQPGNWLFHCHILYHVDPLLRLPVPGDAADHQAHTADARNHMAGLVLGIEVQPEPAAPAPAVPANPRALTLQVGERPGVRYALPDSKETWPGLGYRLMPPGIDEKTVPFTAPGPLLVLTRSEAVAITVENQMAAATTVHWHGIELESYYDGVAGWGNRGSQVTPAIQPGESFIARFTPPRAGTFIYHTHLNDYRQLSTGLYGPLVIVEPGRRFDPATDKVFVLSQGGPDEERDPLLVNGSAAPPVQDWKQGVTYRLRFIGITPAPDVELSLLRGDTILAWQPIAKDGATMTARRAPTPALQDVNPGETFDFEFTPAAAGDLTLRARQFGEIRTTMMIRVK